jgi:hypothetical protein
LPSRCSRNSCFTALRHPLSLAAAGHHEAQRRYGYYVIGYYVTDGMFWPRDKEVAADALAMLHILAVDAPKLLGDEGTWVVGYTEPTDEKKSFPAEWVKRARQVESNHRKCLDSSAHATDR